jgi:opacity protein-like surface antigen
MKTTKAFMLTILALALELPAMAQEVPKAEIFGGYSYAGSGSNGFDAAVTANINKWFGLTADVSGQYSNLTGQGFTERIRSHSFLFGPTVSIRKNNRVTPFAHALFGLSKLHTETTEFGPLLSFHDQSFGMALGGGLDVRVNKNFAIRAVQVDYLRTQFFGDTQNKGRISAGLVIRLGGK